MVRKANGQVHRDAASILEGTMGSKCM